MDKRELVRRKKQLQDILARIEGTSEGLVQEVRTSSGRADGGNLSNVPLHLGDLGTEAYTQELNAVLLDNAEHLRDEIIDALQRIDQGTYGVCARCHRKIPKARLDALPYARYCAKCAEIAASENAANLNEGRPQSWEQTVPTEIGRPRNNRKLKGGEQPAFSRRPAPRATTEAADRHAAGTPGGGSAVGGLGGTNVDDGDPDEIELEGALGSGEFDVEIEGNDEETDTYAGSTGGAVGGTPAGKRAKGGKRKPG